MSKSYYFQFHETANAIDAIRCAVTLDDLVAIEAAVLDCEFRSRRPMIQANQIKAATNIRLTQLADAERNPPRCCKFHATGGHPGDRHGFDSASLVYRTEPASGVVKCGSHP